MRKTLRLMNVEQVKHQVRDWVQWTVPGAILRNRGYVPTLIPVIMLWGGVLAGLLLIEGRRDLAQEMIDFTTYACLGAGALTGLVRGWEEVSKRKLGAAFVWSLFGVVSYFLMGVMALMLMMIGSGMLGLEGEARMLTSMGVGGLLTMYGWYRLNWVVFRWIRNRVEDKEQALVEWGEIT